MRNNKATKKTRNIFKNTARILRDTWKWDPYIFVLAFQLMLATLGANLMNILLIKYLLDELMGEMRPDVIAIMIVSGVLINFICSILNSDFSRKNWYHLVMIRIKYMFQRSEKLLNMPFEDTENPEILDKLAQSKRAIDDSICVSDEGLEKFLKILLTSYITQIPLLLSYLGIISSFSVVLLFVIILTTLLEFLLMSGIEKLNQKVWIVVSEKERELLLGSG